MDMDPHDDLRFLRGLHPQHQDPYLRKLSELYCSYPLRCERCGDDIHHGSEFYCWEELRSQFFVHKHPCAEAPPRVIQRHPSHPQHPLTLQMSEEDISNCSLCKQQLHYYIDCFYRCESCSDFNLHASCALWTLPDNEGEVDGAMLQQKQNIHEHPLSPLVVKLKERFRCRGCEDFIFGESYVCYKCGIFFHKVCIDAPREIQHHPFHPQHPLELVLDGYRLRYSCKECGALPFNITTLISTLPHKEEYDVKQEESRSAISHFAHGHLLNPYHAATEIGYDCKACGKRIVNGFYGCIDCRFLIHESCAKLPSEIRHYLHTDHPLSLVTQLKYGCPPCESCKNSMFLEFAYYCETCPAALHMECACETPVYLEEVAPTSKDRLHEHNLFYVARYWENSPCKVCGQQCHVDLYHCWECGISVHYDCVYLLSKTIKSTFHIDPLTLHESLIEDGYDDNCCDICEGERDPELWVYHCAECYFFAHVKCATSLVRLKPKRENRELALLDKEIGNVKVVVLATKSDLKEKEASLRNMVEKLKALNTRLADVLYVGVMSLPRPLYCLCDRAPYLREMSQHYCGFPLECRRCGGDIHLGSVYYCCERCDFYVHEHPCAIPPPLIPHHPCHPQHAFTLHAFKGDPNCGLCKNKFQEDEDWFYQCKSCSDFNLHADCVIATLPDNEGEVDDATLQCKEHIHEHPLSSLIVKFQKKFRCRGCEDFIFGESYVCYECGIFFHKACIDAPQEIQHHPFHPQHTLELIFDDSKLRYSCRECDDEYFDIPTLISTLPHKEENDVKEENRSAIHHFAHEHPLNPYHVVTEIGYDCEACDYLEEGAPTTIQHLEHEHELTLHHLKGIEDCYWCIQGIKGPGYGCCLDHCDFFIHKSCLDLPSTVRQSSYSHLLTLHHEKFDNQPPCSAFGRKYSRFMFSCAERKLNLDVACAFLERHDLFYLSNNWMKPPCKVCGKPCGVDLFHCWECGVSIHYDCAHLLSRTIESNFHIDPLTLYEYAVEDDYGEYYCDICEGRRNPELWVYYCADCQFFAHVKCATSPVRLNFTMEKVEFRQLEEKIGCIQPQVDVIKASVEEWKTSLEAQWETLKALEARRKELVSQSLKYIKENL